MLDQLTPEQAAIAAIRTLAIDAIERADSGHPGTAIDAAPITYTLWQQFLRFDPADPAWPNRDRFVLSAGHASMLLYSMLHLTQVRAVNPDYEVGGGPSVSMDDIKNFRQLGSHCPGHPEYHLTSGVETTTGPLGQGLATSVGMAIAQRWLAARYNRPGFDVFDYRVYALAGDGCMMEGVASEAASLAGHLQLSNLCWIYDSNRITIEGHTALAFTEDVATRFMGYGWNVWRVGDANDLERLANALRVAQRTTDRSTLIIIDSHIAYGAPDKQDTSAAHGEPLGAEEVRKTKRSYGWPEDAEFLVPGSVYQHFADGIGARGANLRADWERMFAEYRAQHPLLADEIDRMQRRELPEGWDADLPVFPPDPKGMASRESSGKVLNAVATNHPWLIGGAADLAPSTKTRLTFEGAGDFQADAPGGRNFHFGIREHAMAAVANGISLSKVRPFVSGFFIFTDYCRPPIRLASLMELPVIYIWTHDSIGVGEDGPTHQPIEHLASFRAMPGMLVFRPGDANEVVESYRVIMRLRHQPAMLVLSRQAQPTLDRSRYGSAAGTARGGYVVADTDDPAVILIATGTELGLCIEAHERLFAEGIRSRVVSLPCWELFEQQDQAYRDSVLPPGINARVAVEQAATFGWERYVGRRGAVLGMQSFGASAPLRALLTEFGFTVEHVLEAAKEQIAAHVDNQREGDR